jgi:DNA-binding NtrC family response regulator
MQTRAESDAIRYALESVGYNKARAAELLGIHRSLLYKKMHKYEIPVARNRERSERSASSIEH